MTSSSGAADAAASKQHDNRWLVLAIVCLGQLMVILDATIVNVALPAIQKDLELSSEGLQWIVNAYTLAFGGFLLLGGRLGDIFGRRLIFTIGVAIFTIASLLNALAQNEEMLVGARALQGLGGALLSPAALSIITTEFVGSERAKAMSVWGAIAGLGAALGLLLGGVLVKYTSWEWIFLVNIPVGVGVMAAAWTQIAESRATERPALDVAGAFTATAGLVILVFGITQTESEGWGAPIVLGCIAVAIALLTAFVAIERRHKDPLVPLGIFKTRSVSSANTVAFLAFGAIFPFFFFISLFLQQVREYDALETGLAFLPFSVAIILTATVASQAVPKIGVKKSAMFGAAMGGIGMGLFALLLDTDLGYLPGVLLPMIFVAVGMGMTFVPLTFLATSNVPDSEAGLASGLFNTTQQIGGALGLAVLATLANDRWTGQVTEKATAAGVSLPADFSSPTELPTELPFLRDALVSGWSFAFAIGAAMITLAFITAFVRIRDEDADFSAGPAHIG